MRDYITTVFNLITGLVDADKLVLLALIGLGVILIWQLISLLTNFHSHLAKRCRRISKFLTVNGLSSSNYNNFLALIAKMPQEFIRGYKTFEHASYGLPSDYIKRFDSIDVETNGGMLNHGKSFLKAFINAYTIVLALLSLALLGADEAITGFALADSLLVPVLFLILAKTLYFIFNAIKQQQYRVAVDEFNEMLDIMNEKIENNDNLPGPDVLALADEIQEDVEKNEIQDNPQTEPDEQKEEPEIQSEEIEEEKNDNNVVLEQDLAKQKEEISANNVGIENTIVFDSKKENEEPLQKKRVQTKSRKPKQTKKVRLSKKEDNMENKPKRGRGRPKKVPDGELVITNDKQFEEALERAEKLMRKSEEALSASQAKRVEKSLKELVDAMSAYKEQQ